jgi:hypothetical protein
MALRDLFDITAKSAAGDTLSLVFACAAEHVSMCMKAPWRESDGLANLDFHFTRTRDDPEPLPWSGWSNTLTSHLN